MGYFVRQPQSRTSGSALWGVPGKYSRVVTVTGDFTATGSNAGASAVIVSSGATGNINLPDGGSVPAAALDGAGLIEIGVESIDTVSGTIYVFYRQHGTI